MTTLPEEVKKAIAQQELFCVATCSPQCVPNVAYIKFLKVVDDQTILIADNYLAKTKENIINNGQIAFAVLNEQKGAFQIKGTAKRVESGPMFDEVQNWCPEKLPREAAVIMTVEEIYDGAKRIA